MTMECHASGRIVPACAPRYQWAQVALLAAALASLAAGAAHAACPGYSTCPAISYPQILKSNSDAIAIATGIETSEEAALAETTSTTLTAAQRTALIGNLVVFDRRLSVNQNQACMSCHTAGAGFTGGISRIDAGTLTCAACHGGGSGFVGGNASAASFPGSATTRTGNRKPMSLAYAAFAPGLDYNGADFIGGNFWDDRATGFITGSPAADQALAPFTNPAEMALADPACVVYRVATGAYAGFFTQVYGAAALDIDWPANAATICSIVNDGAANQTPLHLSATGRANSTATFHLIGLAVAAFEASPAVSPFSSKFDAYLRHTATLTAQEATGLKLFRGKGKCNDCHVSTGPRPMLTNFTSVNIGIPANPMNPFFLESLPDRHGYVANPAGDNYVDPGSAGSSPARPTPTRPGRRWRRSSSAPSRWRPCATSPPCRAPAFRAPTCTTASSPICRRSCTSTTPATCWRSARHCRPALGRSASTAGRRRRSRPTSIPPRPATSS